MSRAARTAVLDAARDAARNAVSRAARRAVLCAVLGSSPSMAADAAPPTRDPGVWQKHEYAFQFMGFTSTYSCDGLADKLKLLLLAAGARADATSRPGACASGFGRPDVFARADLTFYSLAPPAAATARDVAPVDGTWRPVRLADHSPRELQTGDCELVEQFSTNVLPLFATRNIENHTTCIPHQLSGSVVDLTFESFAAVVKPGVGKTPTP